MSYKEMNRYRFTQRTESAIRHHATPDCQLLVQASCIYLLSATGQPRKEQQLPTCGTLDKQPSWRHKIMTKLLKYSLLDSFSIVQTVSRLSGQFLNCPDSFWIVRTVFELSGLVAIDEVTYGWCRFHKSWAHFRIIKWNSLIFDIVTAEVGYFLSYF